MRASSTVRMPPDALNPTGRPDTAIASSTISAASGVADTAVLPVDVLTKSAPCSMANIVARSIAERSGSSPVSMITFITRAPVSSRTAARTAAARVGVAGQPRRVGQHDVDLVGAGRDGRGGHGGRGVGGIGAGREVDDGGDLDAGAGEPTGALLDELRPHAHRGDPRRGSPVAQRRRRVGGRVGAEVGEVDQRDRSPAERGVGAHGHSPSSARNDSLLGERPRNSSSISVAGRDPPRSRIAVR